MVGCVVLIALAGPAASASGAVTSVFGGKVGCTVDADLHRVCTGGASKLVPSWDGTPLDVSVVLPKAPAAGPDGGFPLVGIYHGYAGSKSSTAALKVWVNRGYAAFSMTTRGFGNSCGRQDATRLSEACAKGYVHLMDTRFEVRDAQHLMGLLADQDVDGRPLIDGRRIGATGGSYGGGMSMALATLRNRVMLEDSTLVPWVTAKGRPMEIAAAAPSVTWSDLAYALFPNGRTLDYTVHNPYGPRLGVPKLSWITTLFAGGGATGFTATPGSDPDADLSKWYALAVAGETTDLDPAKLDMVDELTRHHSSYYIDPSVPPAPMLIASGWTDDLFPADEALRFYNRTRSLHPDVPISLFFADYGHARGQGKSADVGRLSFRQRDWLAHHVKKDGTPVLRGVEASTQTCPATAKSGGPFAAETWADLSAGEVAFSEAAPRVVATTGDPREGTAFDPLYGTATGLLNGAIEDTSLAVPEAIPGDACARVDGADAPGTGVYRLPAAEGAGYTLLGSPTIVADVQSTSPTNQLAARLLDVAPDGTATLVARGTYRPDLTVAGPARQVFQLHPNGWHFAPGHVAKLELLTADATASRASNGQTPVLISNLELRLPVRESPGGAVRKPARPVVPAGHELAPEYLIADAALALASPERGRDTDPVPVSARLTSEGAPVAGQTITFRGAGDTATAITDEDGRASATLTANGAPAAGEVVATFGGTSLHRRAEARRPFELLGELTALAYTGPREARGDTVRLSATLTEDDGPAVSGQTVRFTVGGRDYIATTDAAGQATATATVPDHGRQQTVTATFDGTPRRIGATASAVVRWGG
jgi:predicted acyl esterase